MDNSLVGNFSSIKVHTLSSPTPTYHRPLARSSQPHNLVLDPIRNVKAFPTPLRKNVCWPTWNSFASPYPHDIVGGLVIAIVGSITVPYMDTSLVVPGINWSFPRWSRLTGPSPPSRGNVENTLLVVLALENSNVPVLVPLRC